MATTPTGSKRKQLPPKTCQYGKNCYRRNPLHFEEYSHPHLEKIVSSGKKNDEYEIPEDLSLNADVVLEQVQILERLFPALVSQPAPKQAKKVEVPTVVEIPESDDEEVDKPDPTPPQPPPPPPSSTSKKSPTPDRKIAERIPRDIHEIFPVVAKTGEMARKLEAAAPYNFFLTTVTDSKPTHTDPLSVTFTELLDESLGELESSVQINFMVQLDWLLAHYYFSGNQGKPLLILYGDETDDLRTISAKKPYITALKVDMGGNPFGVHHTKMSLLGYKDGSSRVVVSTANLYEDDWQNRTQGLWISPRLPALPEGSDTAAGESPTGFKDDLIRYLVCYRQPKLQPWIARFRNADFSAVNVCFVASVPGGHRNMPSRGPPWGHPRLGYYLSKHAAPIDESAPIVAQCSSIGSLGGTFQNWIGSDFVNSLRKDSAPLGIRRIPAFKLIYPSFSNVKNSHDGLLGGGCLPYSRSNNEKQPWLRSYLHQWRAKSRLRNQAMPHIKTYCRWTDRGLYWFCLTSANLSKAAWGAYNKTAKLEPPLRINNYEAGVIFLPKFIVGQNYFPLEADKNGVKKFPMPYDIPPQPYAPEDSPFLMDYLRQYMENKMETK